MHLSDHSLRQLDETYLSSLGEEALRALSVKLLDDLKEARERLNQGLDNSARPPSSRAPWERGERTGEADEADGIREGEPAEAEPAEVKPAAANLTVVKPARKAGQQPGAPGVGRTQVLHAHETQAHYSVVCAGCGRPLADSAGAVVYTGFQAIDLRWGDPDAPGLLLWVIDPCYYETPCACGHRTRAEAGQGAVDPLLGGVELSEWRLVGPGLATLQVLRHPELPLTNNAASVPSGHWVIVRQLSHGTRTDTGSRVVALLASVIDTCRQRGQSPWRYLQIAIADRCAGRSLAALPQ